MENRYLENKIVLKYCKDYYRIINEEFSDLDYMSGKVIQIYQTYIFNINAGKTNLYASINIPDIMALMRNEIEYNCNTDYYQVDKYGSFTELIYYIGDEELTNITTNDKYVIEFETAFDYYVPKLTLSLARNSTSELMYFYSDSECSKELEIKAGKIELEVKENLNGEKYIEFYYNIPNETSCSAKVTIIFSILIIVV